MASTIKEEKKVLRRRIKDLLSKIEEDQAKQQSISVTRKVLSLPTYQNARAISIFLSMPGREISTTEIVLDALHRGKRVFIPYIHASPNDQKLKVMDMLRLRDEDDLRSLKPDAWGIPSISSDSVESRENALGGKGVWGLEAAHQPDINLDLILMPGLAFDASKNRLGHGRGFYDRYLSRIHGTRNFPKLVGLGLREQLLAEPDCIPVTQEDWKVDEVVTADSRL